MGAFSAKNYTKKYPNQRTDRSGFADSVVTHQGRWLWRPIGPPFYGLPQSDSHADSLGHRLRCADFQSRGFRDIGAELRAKFGHVVGEERGLVTGAGNGDVPEPGVEQVRMDAGISVHEDALGC